MKRLATLSTFLLLAACAAPAPVVQIADTVCTDMAALPPAAAAALNQVDPHSALGVYWSDAKSACTNGVPTSGVGANWGSQMWGAVKALIPQVLPTLIPLIAAAL